MKRIPIAILIMFMITITNSCIVFSMTNTDPLIIGMEANNPPFEFIDEEGEYRGFNIDIIKGPVPGDGSRYSIEAYGLGRCTCSLAKWRN